MTPLGVIVLVVLVDLLGFTLVMPLLAPFADQYGFKDWQIGFLFSAYPVCQLVAGPILGRLSDRYGRKPLLIFSQAGTALSFLILGLSRDFSVMLLARMLDGASGGNILVAQAYVADVTEPEHRARGMGLIGMAFGRGFRARASARRPAAGVAACTPSGGCGCRSWSPRPFQLSRGCSCSSGCPSRDLKKTGRASAARTLSWRGIVDTVAIPGRRPPGRDRVPRRTGLRGVRGHFCPVPRSSPALGRTNRRICIRGAGVLKRDRAGWIDSPAGPSLR